MKFVIKNKVLKATVIQAAGTVQEAHRRFQGLLRDAIEVDVDPEVMLVVNEEDGDLVVTSAPQELKELHIED